MSLAQLQPQNQLIHLKWGCLEKNTPKKLSFGWMVSIFVRRHFFGAKLTNVCNSAIFLDFASIYWMWALKDLVIISARGAETIFSSLRERSACILQTYGPYVPIKRWTGLELYFGNLFFMQNTLISVLYQLISWYAIQAVTIQ